MIQANRLPLFIIILTLSILALGAPVKAVDATDTFYGTGAGNLTTTGFADSAFGYNALHAVTSGSLNTASGAGALYNNTNGSGNTASGDSSLYYNTTGGDNTASGYSSLFSNTTGDSNTASGAQALYFNTTGRYNTASGAYPLFHNTNGSGNTASGVSVLGSNTTGNNNTASGVYALFYNTTGGSNTASGYSSLFYNTTGSDNIAIGYKAGINLSTGSSNIDIGNLGVAEEANTIRIGTSQSKCFIAGIYGTVLNSSTTTPTQVYVDNTGQLGSRPSSQRFKHDIKPMDSVSEGILSLKPVTFHYKGDQTNTAQFGLIAEEVEKVNPDLVVRDKDGQIYSVRYDEVNAMLLNEFLKEHRKVEELQEIVAKLSARLDSQDAKIQKVSAQLELRKPVPQTLAIRKRAQQSAKD